MTQDQKQRLRPLLKKLVMEVKNELKESSNPEGDRLVKAFVMKLTKLWDIPVQDSVRFIQDSLSRQFKSGI